MWETAAGGGDGPRAEFDYRVLDSATESNRPSVGIYRVEYASTGQLVRRDAEPVALRAESRDDLLCEVEQIVGALRRPVVGEHDGLFSEHGPSLLGSSELAPGSCALGIPLTTDAAVGRRRPKARNSSDPAAPSPHPYREQLGPVADTASARHILKLSRRGLRGRVERGKVLAARTVDGHLIYPMFQFHRQRVIPGLVAASKPFRDRQVDSWAMLDWLTTPAARLGGLTPADVIRRCAMQVDLVLGLAADVASRWAKEEPTGPPKVTSPEAVLRERRHPSSTSGLVASPSARRQQLQRQQPGGEDSV